MMIVEVENLSFSLLYPVCEIMGLDTDLVVTELRAMARKLRLDERDLVLAKRRELVEAMNGIKKASD